MMRIVLKEVCELSRFVIEIPQLQSLKGMRSVISSNYHYAEIAKDSYGLQSHTTYESYNKKLAELNRTLLNKAEDIIQYYDTTQFLIPKDTLHPRGHLDTVKLEYELDSLLYEAILERTGMHFESYKDLVDYIKLVGIPYSNITYIVQCIQTLKIRFDLFQHLNEP